MACCSGALALALTASASGTDLQDLQRLWSGARDSSEVVTVGPAARAQPLADAATERRVRTIIAPVALPWLGGPGLYLEEFLHDEPDRPRRQLLVKLEPAGTGANEIRARLYTFVEPQRWVHLERRPQLLARLRPEDVQSIEGCDLLFAREGAQFEGGTAGQGCLAGSRYVDYQLVLGENLYWYRRRLIRQRDAALEEELIGYNWFELNAARLFTCRVDWSASGRPRDLKPLLRLDVHDKGGRGELLTPDGRRLELTLHSQDWPFAAEHDSLVLLLTESQQSLPLAAAWTVVDEDRIALCLGWLRIRCGSVEPSTDEVHG